MHYDAPPSGINQELVCEFFLRFSVFESALKREGYVQGKRNGPAKPDWDRFGKCVRFQQVQSPELDAAVTMLTSAPPRRQIHRGGGQLGWENLSRSERTEEEFVLRLIRTVRNNLFHGGKYPDGPVDEVARIEEVARNEELLRAALVVLEACCELLPSAGRKVTDP